VTNDGGFAEADLQEVLWIVLLFGDDIPATIEDENGQLLFHVTKSP
jgi:hypothetical protein